LSRIYITVVALVAVLSGLYRHSTRMVQSAMQDIFGITMSLGTVNKLRLEASDAVEEAVLEAKTYVQNSNIVGADETSFSQGNIDGCNSKNSQAWLWVAVTHSQAGSNFVQRMLSVVTSLKSQRRNVLEFMTQAVSAKRQGQPTPTLLPQVPAASVAVKNAA